MAYRFIESGVMTVSGPSGSGKTLLVEKLRDLFKLNGQEIEVFFAGEMLKAEKRRLGEGEIIDFFQRSQDTDRRIDQTQMEILCCAQGPTIIDGRLAGILATEERIDTDRTGKEIPETYTVLVTAGKIRFKRLLKRERERGFKGTLRDITILTLDRENKDSERWAEQHPELKGKNPFDKKLIIYGRQVYDEVIDTTKMTPEEVENRALSGMVRRGFVRRE